MSKRFEKSIADYFDKHGESEYLDLELPRPKKLHTGLFDIFCFDNGHKHQIYTGNEQLNTHSDLLFTINSNLAHIRRQINLQSKVTLKHFHSLNERLSGIEATQNQILRFLPGENLTETLKAVLTRDEAGKLISSVYEHPKKVEQEALRLTERLDHRITELEALLQETKKVAASIAQHF